MLKSIWNRIRSLRYISMPLFLMRPTTENYEITHERKFWTHKIPTRKNLGPKKHPREKTLNTRKIHVKKFGIHEIPTRRYFRPTKSPLENILDLQTTHEKKFWTHEIPTKARWHNGTRPTKFSTLCLS